MPEPVPCRESTLCGRQSPVAHQTAEDGLPLEAGQPDLGRLQHPVPCPELLGLSPSSGREDLVVRSASELRTPVPTWLRHRELEEPLGSTVVEPVHDLLRDDLA